MTAHKNEKAHIDRLREAEQFMREADDLDPEDTEFLTAVANTLRQAAMDLWAHGPLCCADGCDECDDSLWVPHVRRAIAVADAYLGTVYSQRYSPSPVPEQPAQRCPKCMGHGWTGSRHDSGPYGGHYHCSCGAACAVDRAEGCTGARPEGSAR